VLLTVQPLASVYAAIRPLESALTLLDIVAEFALVLTTIGPGKLPIAVHFVLFPGA